MCAGYLLSTNDARMLVDCGAGVLANLSQAIPREALGTVVYAPSAEVPEQ